MHALSRAGASGLDLLSVFLYAASVDTALKGQIKVWMDRCFGYLLNGHYVTHLLFCDDLMLISISITHIQIMARETQVLLHAIGTYQQIQDCVCIKHATCFVLREQCSDGSASVFL